MSLGLRSGLPFSYQCYFLLKIVLEINKRIPNKMKVDVKPEQAHLIIEKTEAI